MKWLIVLLALLPLSVNASIYLEPYFGYGFAKSDVKLTGTFQGAAFDDIDESGSDNGTFFGGKLGYAIPFFAAGVDYLNSEGNPDIGPFLEFRLPLFFKFRATYIMSSVVEEEDNGFKFEGTGYKVGFAFLLFTNVSANIDYFSTSYSKETGSVTGFELDTIDIKQSGVLVSLGLPFEFW